MPQDTAIRCSVYIATSLDGFIARPDGDIDWLDAANAVVPAGEDFGYADFMASVGALVMGRGTYEKVVTFPKWFYGDKPVWVVSRTLQSLAGHLPPQVCLKKLSPREIISEAAEQGMKRLYIDGGKLIQSFLREGLIQDLTITTIPILLGSGLPLFGSLGGDIRLKLLSSKAYPFGFVQSIYEVD